MVHQIPNKNTVSEYTLLQEKLIGLQEQYKTLRSRNLKLEQENEVLRHCWDKARSDIETLSRECKLLQHHLNPEELISDRPRRKANAQV